MPSKKSVCSMSAEFFAWLTTSRTGRETRSLTQADTCCWSQRGVCRVLRYPRTGCIVAPLNRESNTTVLVLTTSCYQFSRHTAMLHVINHDCFVV
ncbi:hypothetical protein VTO42DRAFT_1392 [Malbranchea cinnamomea]